MVQTTHQYVIIPNSFVLVTPSSIKEALDSSFALIRAHQQCISILDSDLNPGRLIVRPIRLPLSQSITLDSA